MFGFQFYRLHFKEFLLKDFEKKMGTNLKLFKSAFEEGSFHDFTRFYKKFIKDLSTIASLLFGEPTKMTVDYDFKLLMSFDTLSLSIDHTLSLEEETKMEFVEFIYFKNQEANEVNHKKF
ncbi:hypothetical protein M9H77_07217 [Catharanthus roseus]|uniref:Uncharacterized protein n=1 Tax=Catharanthus roseus TaxID=4058 RepID=A0ACC0BUA0_CATRO|nr:hypothetical protein M9H77_07217 [Catharanthus roseus]